MSNKDELRGGLGFLILTDQADRSRVGELSSEDQARLVGAMWLLHNKVDTSHGNTLQVDSWQDEIRQSLGLDNCNASQAAGILNTMVQLGFCTTEPNNARARLTPDSETLAMVEAAKAFKAAEEEARVARRFSALQAALGPYARVVTSAEELFEVLGLGRSKSDPDTIEALQALAEDHRINAIVEALLRQYGLATVVAIGAKIEDTLVTYK